MAISSGRRRGWRGRCAAAAGRRLRLSALGGNGAIGEDRDDVVGDLDEAAVDVVPQRFAAAADAQLAVAEAADERRTAGRDAGFAVEERQGDEIGGRVEHRRLGRDDDALERAGVVVWVSAMVSIR